MDIYAFKVKDYTTVLVGQKYEDEFGGGYYVQRGDGTKYEYYLHRVEWEKFLGSFEV